MLAIKRRDEILRQIKQAGSVKVNDLSQRFDVTEETIRRDLDKLDKEGKVKKIYGGAIIPQSLSEDETYKVRGQRNIRQKQRIAKKAQDLIQTGATLFIDASTTALEVIKAIPDNIEVTVITNSVAAINELNQYKHLKLICIGGTVNPRTLAMEGPMTTHVLDDYYADLAIFSCKGITKERGIMDSREVVADIKTHMIKNASTSVLCLDEGKFEQSAMVRMALDNIDYLITEMSLDDQWQDYFNQHQMTVLKA